MKEKGLVVEALPGGKARVKFSAGGACARCRACMIEGGQWAMVDAENDLNARAGDTVEVDISSAVFIWASFVLFIVPLFFMGAGYFAGALLSKALNIQNEQGAGASFAILFFAVSFIIIWAYDRRVGRTRGFVSRITKVHKG